MTERLINYDPEVLHKRLLSANPPFYASDDRSRPGRRDEMRRKLVSLMGLDRMTAPPSAAEGKALVTEGESLCGGFRALSFSVETEEGYYIPCKLLLPAGDKPAGGWPLMLCLQGHTTGMHISFGEAQFEGDAEHIAGDPDFAIQAARRGYAAIACEQRCFGLSASTDENGARKPCRQPSVQALLLGRTMIGERVFDLMRLLDELPALDAADLSRIYCMGTSGGGTVTFFLTCCDERVKACMPSCYFCSLTESIFPILHCEDNYIPGILEWFDLGELCALIAPRPMVIVAGRHDPIFPLHGVLSQFDSCRRLYAEAGAPDSCRLVVGEAGHRFYAGEAWPVFDLISRS